MADAEKVAEPTVAQGTETEQVNASVDADAAAPADAAATAAPAADASPEAQVQTAESGKNGEPAHGVEKDEGEEKSGKEGGENTHHHRSDRRHRDERDWRDRRDEDDRRHGRHSGGSKRGHGHSRGGFHKKSYPSEVKSRYEDMEETKDPEEIRRQVDFYLGDANLPYDKFLLEKSGLPDEHNFIPIKLIADFNRMKRFQPYAAIVDALRASETLEVSPAEDMPSQHGQESVRRREKPTVHSSDAIVNKAHAEASLASRTIYVKGFPEETPSTQLDIEQLFEPYGPVAVRLRRQMPHKNFKGSVFVEFATEDEAKQVLEMDGKPKFVAAGAKEGVDLTWVSKAQYDKDHPQDVMARKRNERRNEEEFEERMARRGGRGGRGGRGRGRGRGRDRDGWDDRGRRDRDDRRRDRDDGRRDRDGGRRDRDRDGARRDRDRDEQGVREPGRRQKDDTADRDRENAPVTGNKKRERSSDGVDLEPEAKRGKGENGGKVDRAADEAAGAKEEPKS